MRVHVDRPLLRGLPRLSQAPPESHHVLPGIPREGAIAHSADIDTYVLDVEDHTNSPIVHLQVLEHQFTALPEIVLTPVSVPILRQALLDHPARDLVDFVLFGFTFGFDIGFRGVGLPSRPRNLRSAIDNPTAVSRAIAKELRRGHTAGPFSTPPFPCLHCSPLGSAPKKDGSVRLVLDLSSPRGCAINEDISKDEFSVTYSSFDDAVRLVARIGTHAMMAKLDIQHAFRLCPVRLDQLHLLGFRWFDLFFVDLRLPFGSRSSPFIFSQFADLLAWVLINIVGILFLLHYLDDFFLASDSSDTCSRYIANMLSFCHQAGIPIAHDKSVGPTSRMVYLGIEIDAATQVVSLPEEKLREIQLLVAAWISKDKCTKRELLSLIGSLSFAAKVVQPGRLFVRRLIDLSTTVKSLSHFIYINKGAKADIRWWHRFLTRWNGKQFFCVEQLLSSDLSLATDASSLGIGAVCGSSWFSVQIPSHLHHIHINAFELFAIFAAVVVWGHTWANKRVLFLTDNTCVVQVASAGTCKNEVIMRILRSMFMFTATWNIRLTFRHIPGSSNLYADLLSRLQVQQFRQAMPSADRSPSVVPERIWQVFEDSDTDS